MNTLQVLAVRILGTTTTEVVETLTKGLEQIQTVITALFVVIAIIACAKILIKHMPNLDDPNVKNEMWRSITGVLVALAAGAAIIWIAPWIYGLFT